MRSRTVLVKLAVVGVELLPQRRHVAVELRHALLGLLVCAVIGQQPRLFVCVVCVSAHVCVCLCVLVRACARGIMQECMCIRVCI